MFTKKIITFTLVLMMAFTFIPFFGGNPFFGDGVDVVSAATGSGGGGGGGGTTVTAPKAPTTLTLSGTAGATSVSFTWKDNATNESGFKVERVVKGGAAWTQIASVGANITTYTDNTVQPSTTYYYRIKACNAGGTSAASNELVITTAAGGAVVTPPANGGVTATPTSSKVVVDGKDISFDAYNINGNNYFKLRDVAAAVNGSAKNFGVTYDEAVKAINLTSNSPYAAVGGELAAGDGKVKSGTLNKAPIYKDGVLVELTAYNINGNNYFKLRDLAKAFDIGVTWNAETNTVGIDTSISYTE
jgi:hypothetical protein